MIFVLIGDRVTILGRDTGLRGTVGWDNSIFLPVGLSGSPGLLHCTWRDRNHLLLSQIDLFPCVFPLKLFTLFALRSHMLCDLRVRVVVPPAAGSHGPREPFLPLPCVALGAATKHLSRFGKSCRFSPWHTAWVSRSQAASTWPWGCVVSFLISKREGLNIGECSQLPVLCSKNLSGLRQWKPTQHVLQVCFSEGICLNIFSK